MDYSLCERITAPDSRFICEKHYYGDTPWWARVCKLRDFFNYRNGYISPLCNNPAWLVVIFAFYRLVTSP